MLTEKDAWQMNGYLGIMIIVILFVVSLFSIWNDQLFLAIISILIAFLLIIGITINQPNEASVVLLFGQYVGSIREGGVVITIPFSKRKKVSLRRQHVKQNNLQVTDSNGVSFTISYIVTYKIVDCAKAIFEVEYYHEHIQLQSDIALRIITSQYNYEHIRQQLLSDKEAITNEFGIELQKRTSAIGVDIIEAQIFS